jgi:hypothetical protein
MGRAVPSSRSGRAACARSLRPPPNPSHVDPHAPSHRPIAPTDDPAAAHVSASVLRRRSQPTRHLRGRSSKALPPSRGLALPSFSRVPETQGLADSRARGVRETRGLPESRSRSIQETPGLRERSRERSGRPEVSSIPDLRRVVFPKRLAGLPERPPPRGEESRNSSQHLFVGGHEDLCVDAQHPACPTRHANEVASPHVRESARERRCHATTSRLRGGRCRHVR